MKIKNIINTIEKYAPLNFAEEWDNIGLLSGDLQGQTNTVVLCLDITQKVFERCIKTDAKLCVSHHPFIFNPIKRLDFTDPHIRLLDSFIRHGIAIYAAHTNLDACDGGVSDSFVKTLGLTLIKPENEINNTISSYLHFGRLCESNGMDLFAHYENVVKKLKINGCITNFDQNKPITKIFISGGSYNAEWTRDIVNKGVDLVITGEMKHNDSITLARHNISAIIAGHDPSERVVLPFLSDYLKSNLDKVQIEVCSGLDYNKIVF